MIEKNVDITYFHKLKNPTFLGSVAPQSSRLVCGPGSSSTLIMEKTTEWFAESDISGKTLIFAS